LHETAVGLVRNYNLQSMIVRKAIATMTALGMAMVHTTRKAAFSEVSFKFRPTPARRSAGLASTALMSAVSGLLPALRAARIPVARALREI
jgi:ABC-type antimicrobial peptide transport system permease subunit